MDSVIPGTMIADRYRLVRPLGAGSSATVWEASDTALDRTVAVKLLHGSALADPTERERLRREARALARLAHPRITVVFDYLEQRQPDGTAQPVLVTELLHGTTLSDRLLSGPLPTAEAVAVCAQLADALRSAHDAGIVHRDVKPGNVMLTASGAKLLDFGIAQTAWDSNLTGNMAIGTPACMAPEQLTGHGAVPASDMYALGCVLHWCLTGMPPFESRDVTQVAHAHLYAPAPPLNVVGLSPGIVDLYTRCMAKDAAQRPNAAEVYARLSQIPLPPAAQRTLLMPAFDVPTQLTSLPPRHDATAVRPDRQSRTRLLAGALVIAAVAAGVTAMALELSKSNGSNGTPPPTTSSSTAPGSASSSPTPSPSPSESPTLGDPAGDPIGYLEAMRGQIDGFIAQGQDTIDPNTGRDIQNSLGDLEQAIADARSHGGGNSKWRDVRQKINDVTQKISDATDNNMISQDAANQLTSELQALSNALPGSSNN
ncbi:serine/threonine-protein kinase [Actinocrinis sp.]|uniref:serine/threonine-protein kinase n=1 Tax=Actinocrinis sp. TaxID=1920516 RepID=UPI002DDD30ED|nr:serine/threonine-protein kinase [Actinocrinis sp.]